jgi:hypothetical protein
MKDAFCAFCDCDQCQHGDPLVLHCQTEDGSWICDVCWKWDVCTSGPLRNSNGPCEEANCIHRPKLVGEWIAFDPEATSEPS